MNLNRRDLMLRALATAAACSGGLAGPWHDAAAAGAPRSTLTAYADEAEFIDALTRWGRQAERQRAARSAGTTGTVNAAADTKLEASAQAPAAPMAKSSLAESRSDARESDSITNVQTAGVDEGGIVKRAGDHLVILRRGRLFTVRVGADALQPVAAIDAYAPGSNPRGAWYDELLISGSTVVVIGYSYARGGTEVGLFEIDRGGALSYRATVHLRSFDYYSSRNYASRLIGSRLVFYSPLLLSPWQPRPWEQLPAFRRWQGESDASGF